MKVKRERGKRNRIWRVLLGVVLLAMMAVLELGKHTVWGWALTVAALVGFALLRGKGLAHSGRWARFAAWCGLLLAFVGILWVSWPPMRPVPAVAGKTGGVTEVVHVAQGDLTGVVTADGQIEVYAGIPYAEPPVGKLRWREPQPAEAWEGILVADHFAPYRELYAILDEMYGYDPGTTPARPNKG